MGWNGKKRWDREWIKGSGTLRTDMTPQGPGAGFLEAGGIGVGPQGSSIFHIQALFTTSACPCGSRPTL